jgi:hypothetical protein
MIETGSMATGTIEFGLPQKAIGLMHLLFVMTPCW